MSQDRLGAPRHVTDHEIDAPTILPPFMGEEASDSYPPLPTNSSRAAPQPDEACRGWLRLGAPAGGI